MATDFSNNPIGGWTNANGYLYVNSQDSKYGILPSELLIGGYTSTTTIVERDAIPIRYNQGDTVSIDEMITPDGLGSGRRKIGMVVRVVDPSGDGSVEPKTYCLIPKGYFNNGGQLSTLEWNALNNYQKAVLLDPTQSFTYTDIINGVPTQVTENGSGNPDDCWVELIQFTEHPLPAGGSAGEVLVKIDAEDHNVAWVPGLQDTSQAFRIDVINGVFQSGGVSQPSFLMLAGHRYEISQTSLSNSGHPVKLSDTPDGTHGGGVEYTTGVTYTGTAGTDGVLTIDVTVNTPQLYYYCENHPNMGGTINISTIHQFYNGKFNTHLIPDTNATYDIGSAEYKIRHLYLSDNSIYFGDNDVQLNSEKVLNTLNFSVDPTVPINSADPVPGQKGDIRFDLTHMYICVEDNLWKRITLDDTFNI